MFSQYAMSPNGSTSCPPMEPTYSNSSEFSMQSSNMGYFNNVYGVDETDFELCPQPSHPSSASSVYASSYPSSFSSSYTSSPFEPSFDISPPMMCQSDVPPSLQAQFFAPMQGSWPVPTTQAPSIDEPLFSQDTQYMMMSDMSDMPDTSKPAKPYVCPCGKAFTRPADLKRHESTVHNPVYKDCPVEECLRKASNGFPRQDHLIEHLRSYHHLDVPKRRVIKRIPKSS